ncbi:MAG: SusD/RagB family nutrient-binding outer membrane lipoprotein [Saprospiraceae bacterium]|jgi:hypothetical protein|nr:SusD/RagB family nutrient-binding outer membrane lipoprotein [Saprospiraceae bacterium]
MRSKIIISIFSFLLMCTVSCSDYLDINEDPSFPQVADGYTLLPSIHANMVRASAWDSRYIGQYVQYWGWVTSGNVWDLHGYAAASDACGEHWRSHYWSIGTNIDLVIQDGIKNNRPDYIGAAKAIRAWSWQANTDLHGEMILKQAWEPNRYVFDFDSQEEVYKEVVKLCEEAIVEFDKTGYAKSLSRGDLVYKGDVDKWKKFTYGILARNSNNLTNKATYNPDKVIGFVDKALASNADNFSVPHLATGTTDANFYGPLRNNMGNFRQSAYIISLLDGTVFNTVVDPRLGRMFVACPDGVFRGVLPGGGDPNNVLNNTKRIPNLWGALGVAPTVGKWIFDNATPHNIMTYAEMQFIKAEAAFIKKDVTTSMDAFLKGVGASLDFIGVPAVDKAKYLTSAAIPQSAGALTLSDIMLQKYIALYAMNSVETWTDMRKYNYDVAVYKGFSFPSVFSTVNNRLPVQRIRPRYNSEYVWNRESLNKFGALEDSYHTNVLWFTQK